LHKASRTVAQRNEAHLFAITHEALKQWFGHRG
jgi:hypothetical protein